MGAANMNGDVWHLVLMFVAPHEELHQLLLSMRLWCHACRQAVETSETSPSCSRPTRVHGMRGSAGTGHHHSTVLNDARRLKSLDVKYNSQIVTVTPFPELTALEAQCSCGIGDAGLTGARRLAVLKCAQNPRITTVRPFARTLTSLDAGGRGCGLGDAGLAGATALTALRAWDNVKITTVTPFAGSLTKLDASGTSGIADVALARATRLTTLTARDNSTITTLQPFAHSLAALDAGGPPTAGSTTQA